jgi:hypothetical protein
MDCTANRFVRRQLERLFAIERDIIRLYAEACYANIQGACGNRSCAERVEENYQAIREASDSLNALKNDLRRLGVPADAMISLDDLQKLDVFEAQFQQHNAAFVGRGHRLGRMQLSVMLEDIACLKENGRQK